MDEPRPDPGDEVVLEEVAGAPPALEIAAEDDEPEHVEEEVGESAVEEHVGDELPHPALGDHLLGHQREPHLDLRRELLDQKDDDVDEDELADGGREAEDAPRAVPGVLPMTQGRSSIVGCTILSLARIIAEG